MSSEQSSTNQTATSNRPIWATIGAVLVLVLVVVGGVALKAVRERTLAKQQAEKAALEKFSAEADAARKQIAAEYEQSDGSVTTDRQDEIIEKMEAMGKAAGGDTEKITSAVATIGREWGEIGKGYATFIESFTSSGGLQPATLASPEIIDARLALIENGRRSNNEMIAAIREGKPRLEKMLLDKGMSAKNARDAAAGAASKWNTALAMRAIQTRFLDGSRDYLAVLREQWGAWSIEEGTGQIVFEQQEAADRFNDASQRVLKAGEEEGEWMKNFAK